MYILILVSGHIISGCVIYRSERVLAGVKERIGELFAFSKSGFNYLEAGDIGQKVAHRRIGISGHAARVSIVAIHTINTIRVLHCRKVL